MKNTIGIRRSGRKAGLICFKHWSRKRFSVLTSQHKIIKIGVLCLAYSLVNKMPLIMAQGDSTKTMESIQKLEEVEIDGRRSQAVFSESARFVTVISKSEIEQAGVGSIADLLEYVSNIDVRQRGQNGIQADVSLRGGSHDQVMLLVNGINLSDPQTGHFSMDIPIDPEQIERIEICEGPAARTLGADAFTGAINIITTTGGEKKLTASILAGRYGYNRGYLGLKGNTGMISHSLSASRSSSEGYMQNTAFKLNQVFYRGNLHLKNTGIDFQSGVQQKHFGAGGFYSPRFPDQYEETGTWFSSIKVTTGKKLLITPWLYWRRKKDHFILIHSNPHYYENFHRTDVLGGHLQVSFGSRVIKTALGLDVRSESILSNNMGFVMSEPIPVKGSDGAFYTRHYSRTNLAWFQEHQISLQKLKITGGIMFNWNSGFPDKPGIFPGLDISYDLSRKFVIYANINRVLHLPTFTDLFYKDPGNEGNFNLRPNSMLSSETGMKWKDDNRYDIKLACFYNRGRDIIDWLWSFHERKFAPVNLDHYAAAGLTSTCSAHFSETGIATFFIRRLSVCYLFLHENKSVPDSVSKYYNLRHKISLDIEQQIVENINISWDISYQNRYGEAIGYDQEGGDYFAAPYKPIWLVNVSLTRKFRFVNLYAEISNLFDIRYIDAGSSVQPGRCYKAGISIEL